VGRCFLHEEKGLKLHQYTYDPYGCCKDQTAKAPRRSSTQSLAVRTTRTGPSVYRPAHSGVAA
jgi:hypothetical protein